MKLLRKIFAPTGTSQPRRGRPHFDIEEELKQYYLAFESETSRQNRRQAIQVFCKKRLGTGALPTIAALYAQTDDPLTRMLLARRCYQLRRDYLASFKEYSDRALAILVQRDDFFDKWEGIFILGCFGGDAGIRFLNEYLQRETDPLLQTTAVNAIAKIRTNKERKKAQRGF